MFPPGAPEKENMSSPFQQQPSTPWVSSPSPPSPQPLPTDCQFAICGAGIVGLVLALCLHKDLGIRARVYEQAACFSFDTIGAGMGMYANGLRVLGHVSPDVLAAVQAAGYPYLVRRYERHDGTSIAVAQEETLGDDLLQSMGIKRGRLQKILYHAALEAGIDIYFGKQVAAVHDEGMAIGLIFCDGTTCRTEFLFAADGAHSQVRAQVLEWEQVIHDAVVNEPKIETTSTLSEHDAEKDPMDPTDPSTAKVPSKDGTAGRKMGAATTIMGQATVSKQKEEVPGLVYTGTTCLYGLASVGRPQRGICFPSSLSSKFHAVFFPTGENEQCFQLHTHVPELDRAIETWGVKSFQETQAECQALAKQLRAEGWHEDYLKPLENVSHAIRVGFCLLQPRLSTWVYGSQKRIILLGDAAHPPVPYTGQGCQIGLEDAGILSLLLKHMCLDIDGRFQSTNFGTVSKLFEQMRIPRCRTMLDKAQYWGKVQHQRSQSESRNSARETLITRDVFFHETLPILSPGATYDFIKEVEHVLAQEPVHLAMVKEE